MKATVQYFPVVLFIMLYKVVLTFKSVDEILKSDHSNEVYRPVFSKPRVLYIFTSSSLEILENLSTRLFSYEM